VASAQRIVAIGGGHGLAATLRALRSLGCKPTAIVGTGDDGGSSGRLRSHLGVPPPGDLRMASVALADEGLWPRVVQHRFGGTGDVEGHALGNLMLAALWEESGDIVAGLDRLGGLLGVQGRVLPHCLEPIEVIADVVTADGSIVEVRGQAALTMTPGRIATLRIAPSQPAGCPEALTAIGEATHIILGPGSWFTSVLPHLLIPDIAQAMMASTARRILVLNAGPQPGETAGFTAHRHLETWAEVAPGVGLDLVIADPRSVDDRSALLRAAAAVGARVHLADVLAQPGNHAPSLLAGALEHALEAALPASTGPHGRMARWP
jgi:uncharacterized cofD-like protein